MGTGQRPHDPCDSQGDCVSSSVSFIRSNPDGSLYTGDSFSVPLSITTGQNTTGYSVSWSYAPVFGRTGDTFTVIENEAGTFTITATVTFTGSAFSSTLTSSQSVTVIRFVLDLGSRIVNMTGGGGCLARNPDGTFYQGDSFGIRYNATFAWEKQRADIGVMTTVQYDTTAFYESGHNTTDFLFNMTRVASPRVYAFVLNATATNSYGERIETNVTTVYVAAVAYRPMFTYMTYVDYNNPNSSAYRRPFVTLVRYGGNEPGYSSPGGQTWDAFTASNSTSERAVIDSFTFSTVGWSVHSNFVSANITQNVAYSPSTGLDLRTSSLNKTLCSCQQVLQWSHRVQKYYFSADWKTILNYTSKGIIYFNTTISAWSRNFPYQGNGLRLFNTSYLQEPAYYNGILIFRTYNGLGEPDKSVLNVTIKVFNPSPLDPYLISELKSRFGSDPSVERAFVHDLYPANSSMTLRPYQVKNGAWYFVLNQTNIATTANATQPMYTISVIGSTTGEATYSFVPSFSYAECAGQSGTVSAYNFTYRTVGSLSTIVISNKSFTPAPFGTFTGYYVEPRGSLAALPMNFTYPANFTYGGSMSYLLWSYNKSTPFYITTAIPGQVSKEYEMMWGQNVTVPVCIGGCLFGLASPPLAVGATAIQVTPVLGQMSGGATQVWVKNNLGTLLDNESVPSNYPQVGSFAPPGFIGLRTLEFNMPDNSTSISLFVRNSWGAVAVLRGIPLTSPQPTSLTGGGLVLILTVASLLVVGFLFLGELNRRLRTRVS